MCNENNGNMNCNSTAKCASCVSCSHAEGIICTNPSYYIPKKDGSCGGFKA